VRMLSNFETKRDKLIQIILSGQPQLAENIGSPELLQLRQRISIFARLKPFTPEETVHYVAHRVRSAGYGSDMPLFTKDALALISLCSEGIPRNINNLCFNALSLGFSLQQKPVDRDILRQVIADLDLGPMRRKLSLPPPPEESPAPKPAQISTTNTSSIFAGWLPRVAFAVVALLAVGGVLFENREWLSRTFVSQPAASQAPMAADPPAPLTAAPPVEGSSALPTTAPSASTPIESIQPPPGSSVLPGSPIAVPANAPPTVQPGRSGLALVPKTSNVPAANLATDP
jgi:hypothetical protein